MRDEILPEALKRGVEVETTAAIVVRYLQLVREFHPREQGGKYGEMHEWTSMFSPIRRSDSTASFPTDLDPRHVAVEWLDAHTIGPEPLLPILGTAWTDVIDGDIPNHCFRDTLI